jgi:Fe-S-cluster containining protein
MQPATDIPFDPDFFREVYAAAGRPEVRAAVESIYTHLQHEIDTRKPICQTSGRCCRFEEFGHRLYVTTIELAAFVYGLEISSAAMSPPTPQLWDGTGCPYQVQGLCSVHTIRPFGCRIFFCDPSSTAWQHEQYERFHSQLKSLHESFNVPYRYLEWRGALSRLGLGCHPMIRTLTTERIPE